MAGPAHFERLHVVGQEFHVHINFGDVVSLVAWQERCCGEDVFSIQGILDPGFERLELSVFSRIAEDSCYIDEIQGRQMIEVQYVRLQVVGGQDEVLLKSSVQGGNNSVGRFLSLNGSDPVSDGADSADPLGDLLCVKGISTHEDLFDASEHFTFAAGRGDDDVARAIDRRCVGMNGQMALNPSNRTNGDSSHDSFLP